MAVRNKPHIVVSTMPLSEGYTPHKQKIVVPKVPPPPDRAARGAELRNAFTDAIQQAEERRQQSQVTIPGATPALYIQFESAEGVSLDLGTLEAVRSGVELVAVQRQVTELPDGTPSFIERATVVVPDDKVGHFLKRFEEYSNTAPKGKSSERRHENMLDRVARVRLATLKALWTDIGTDFPSGNEMHWWEVWLRRPHPTQKKQRTNTFEQFRTFCSETNLALTERLEFEDRIVVLVHATAEQLSRSIDVLNDIAEVRAVNEAAGFFGELPATGQAEWVDDLIQRTAAANEAAPAVCILDCGVNRGHPLLSQHIAAGDVHAVDPTWIANDDHGHGTQMAGLALYGNLATELASQAQLEIHHRLESVRILPPNGHAPNHPHLYGAVTASATSVVEIAAPDRKRCFSMAVGADADKGLGIPTSWSAAIDALAAGRSFDTDRRGLFYLDEDAAPSRLFIVSAGNVKAEAFSVDHLALSDASLIDDPGQAWNALVVGASTALVNIDHPDWANWLAVSNVGELSPWSKTSLSFGTQWPNKPDVVFEGGNVAHDQAGEFDFPIPNLSVLTTHFDPGQRAFALSWATSAACAQVAHIAARVMATYPALQPETVRALIVHSADWTDAMKQHLVGRPGKTARSNMLRRYGFGVPRVERALKSAADALTLIVEGAIEPFNNGHLHQIHFHTLPWPKAALAQLAAAGVQLRVTLSYFIEPNPSRRGWRKKHRYQSHGLRFAVKGPAESLDEFRKRLNVQALNDDEHKPDSPHDDGWFLGSRARERGSLHSDIWNGFAADLAEREIIAVYPVSGWWKEQPARDRSQRQVRYSMVVSIETAATEVDIWTPVAEEVGIAVEPIAVMT